MGEGIQEAKIDYAILSVFFSGRQIILEISLNLSQPYVEKLKK